MAWSQEGRPPPAMKFSHVRIRQSSGRPGPTAARSQLSTSAGFDVRHCPDQRQARGGTGQLCTCLSEVLPGKAVEDGLARTLPDPSSLFVGLKTTKQNMVNLKY